MAYALPESGLVTEAVGWGPPGTREPSRAASPNTASCAGSGRKLRLSREHANSVIAAQATAPAILGIGLPGFYGSAKTYNIPPLVVYFPRSAMAVENPSAPVPSIVLRPPATTAPAHPPTPDSTAMYSLPSGP